MYHPPLRLGLTLWSHNQWQHSFYGKGTKPAERLEKYATVFNTVEGNTTFYATPAPKTVQSWNQATGADFRFTFKLPSEITHQNKLRHSRQALHEFLSIMEPLFPKIGQWTIQLPASFSPSELHYLKAFCDLFPKEAKLGVEVRHTGFFSKSAQEKAFNAYLVESGINRIIMDSRPVFAAKPNSADIIDAQQKKPKVPVHAIATSDTPLIRYIGHPILAENDHYFKPWIVKLSQWLKAGKQPYLMIHTPNNDEAPQLAVELYRQLQQQTPLPDLARFPALNNDTQLEIF